MVVVAPVVPIWVKVTPSGERSTLKPVWLVALFVQERLICVALGAVAVRPEGAAGAPARVVALPTLEGELGFPAASLAMIS